MGYAICRPEAGFYAPATLGNSISFIRLAIRRRKKIGLTYTDNTSQKTNRVIWPIFLGYRETSLIIAAWCELRAGFRYFRTERIIEASVLKDNIPNRMDLVPAEWHRATDAERQRYEEGR
ncbi:WYL domain-containing protein [uncultured Tateyamaria sp.]|uniref:helix-turn-helix transcriptional regulator n=1 Tax=uncultured Tateyamaria sp. TaxID=455651 RepID=UPI002618A665|nr:WYL domain-containing protein [uncultured Tateyamaria sp.]